MAAIIYQTCYYFFVVLEAILMVYIVLSWLPLGEKLRLILSALIGPMLNPIRFLLKHSVFYTQIADLSPILCFILLSFAQQFFYLLIS